jgi:tetratricopeptide (TPR) repeat protein
MSKTTRPKASRADRKGRQSGRTPKSTRPGPVAQRANALLKATPPAGFSPAPLPDAQALALFQEALEAVQRHAFKPAADSFRLLLERFPGERAVLDRARVYLGLCERELARRPADPRTLEERLTTATAALNNGDETLAARLAESVLSDAPEHDLALYLMAAVSSRRGDVQRALGYLTRAVSSSPEVRAQARHDADFEPLHDLEAFQALLEGPPASTLSPRARRFR